MQFCSNNNWILPVIKDWDQCFWESLALSSSCSCESASEAGAAAAVPTTLSSESTTEDDGDEQSGKSQEKIERSGSTIITLFFKHYITVKLVFPSPFFSLL